MAQNAKPMEDYQLLPAEPSDVPDMVSIFLEAFADDEVVGHIERHVESGESHRKNEEWYSDQMAHAHLTGDRFFKVVEVSSGKLAAFAKWIYPITLDPAQKTERDAWQKEASKRTHAEGTNVALFEDFIGQLNEKRKHHVDPEKDYFLHILATHPSHHRRGLGSLLIKRGLSDADRDAARTYIEASKAGLPLYKRHGWVPVDAVRVDLEKHGIGKGWFEEVTLMREAHVSM